MWFSLKNDLRRPTSLLHVATHRTDRQTLKREMTSLRSFLLVARSWTQASFIATCYTRKQKVLIYEVEPRLISTEVNLLTCLRHSPILTDIIKVWKSHRLMMRAGKLSNWLLEQLLEITSRPAGKREKTGETPVPIQKENWLNLPCPQASSQWRRPMARQLVGKRVSD